MLETVFLAVNGGVAGIIIGYAITILFNHKGIDLSAWAEAYEKLGYETMVYPVINADIAVKVALMVVLTGILASIYPALKALKLKPAEALHIDI